MRLAGRVWRFRLERCWRTRNPLALALLPLSWLFCLLAVVRRRAYAAGWLRSRALPVPVVVVGNVTVGGTGKTPLVIRLVEMLRELGYRPGVLSRGYGGRGRRRPQPVEADADPRQVGDEPVLIARRTGAPLWVSPDRYQAGRALLEQEPCDILLCDDGLQHYALRRNLEIAVTDERGAGNGFCLPAGPLREPRGRLRSVDLQVINGGEAGDAAEPMRLRPGDAFRVADPGRTRALADFAGEPVHAVAGIGHPARFFATLRDQGLEPIEHPFPDHHLFGAHDLRFGDDRPVLMTEKDAVKCRSFADDRLWAVPVHARLEPRFERRLRELLGERDHGQTTA